MKRILPACICIAIAFSVRADVIEFQNGTKSEGRVLTLFNQRFEVADKDGGVTRVSLQDVKRIQFDSRTATIVTRDRKTLKGQLLALENGTFSVESENGAQQIATAQVVDLTVSNLKPDAPRPSSPASPAKTKPPSPPPAPVTVSAPPPAASAKTSADPQPGKVTIVDFYADWCGPCRMISPVLEKIAAGDSGIVLRKVNVDQNQELAQRYGVRGIPHIIIYDKNGKKVDTVVGANEPRVRQAVDKANGREGEPSLWERLTMRK